MFRLSRLAPVVGAPLTLVALLASILPAGAALVPNALNANGISTNGIALNGLASNALNANAMNPNSLTQNALNANAMVPTALIPNALAATGSGLGELNGVSIEAVTLPEATTR
ncbi:MAG TPA: hypothetical protein VMU78_06660 [Methylocella sp.]|nr:hypothetical protein [Methylocella sp.]